MNITKDIRYIGVNDHEIDLFEGQYIVPNGMAYNSYAILDGKTAVIDTVDVRFRDEWFGNIKNVLGGKAPDYLVVHHMEPDHAGNIAAFMDAYKTTTIGGQVWMAENLNYFDIEGAPSSIKNDWCYWDKPENCESAGRLYTWKVAKRVCPEGWRLPTNDDWTALLTAVGADTLNPIAWTGANVLKSKSGWENSGSGTDDFGFTALPAGKAFFNDLQSGFTNHGCSSYMWSATEADLAAGGDTLAFSVELNCSNELAIVNTVKKYSGFSVRCVKE